MNNPFHVPRTIISALYPQRYQDSYTEILMWVWFEELSEPIQFCASPFDCEGHGRELWFRAMKGEYGEIEVINGPSPLELLEANKQLKLLEYGGDNS